MTVRIIQLHYVSEVIIQIFAEWQLTVTRCSNQTSLSRVWTCYLKKEQALDLWSGSTTLLLNDLNINESWYITYGYIWATNNIWYMAKGHPSGGWAPIGFAVAAPWTNLPQGIVLGIVVWWTHIGFAVMTTPRPFQWNNMIPDIPSYPS